VWQTHGESVKSPCPVYLSTTANQIHNREPHPDIPLQRRGSVFQLGQHVCAEPGLGGAERQPLGPVQVGQDPEPGHEVLVQGSRPASPTNTSQLRGLPSASAPWTCQPRSRNNPSMSQLQGTQTPVTFPGAVQCLSTTSSPPAAPLRPIYGAPPASVPRTSDAPVAARIGRRVKYPAQPCTARCITWSAPNRPVIKQARRR